MSSRKVVKSVFTAYTVFMKRVYFDHAAATPIDPRVIAAMEPFFGVSYGNPGAIHKEGVLARRAVDDARFRIAGLLDVHADEIVFTASATESANLAIIGAVRAWQQTHPDKTAHIIVSAIEHDAVLEPVRFLEREGVRVTILHVDGEGIVDVAKLKEMLTSETVLVSVMYVNNEIGTIQPIREIAKSLRKWKKEHRGVVRTEKPKDDDRYPLFHTDACQAANYCDMRIPSLGVDLLTLNAAKVYGPKGIGLLFVARDTSLRPLIVGGAQEWGLRAGTENVSGIVGFAEALTLAREIAEQESARLMPLRDRMILLLRARSPKIIINGSISERLPNNVNFTVPDVDHEFLSLALDAAGFAVATKSACNEFDAETSHVLAAIRASRESDASESGIRLSFGRSTTESDVDSFIDTLRDVLTTITISFSQNLQK
jgi:cysteine desulfurase